MKVVLSLMKNVVKPLAKIVLVALRKTAADAGIHLKIYVSERSLYLAQQSTTLIISNKKMENIIKAVTFVK